MNNTTGPVTVFTYAETSEMCGYLGTSPKMYVVETETIPAEINACIEVIERTCSHGGPDASCGPCNEEGHAFGILLTYLECQNTTDPCLLLNKFVTKVVPLKNWSVNSGAQKPPAEYVHLYPEGLEEKWESAYNTRPE